MAVWPIGSKVAPEATTAVDVSQITSELDTEIVAPAVESQLTSVEATDASPRNDNVIPTDVSPTQNNEVTPANTSPMQTDEVIPTINLQLFQVFEGEEAPEFFPWGLRKDCVKIEKGFERVSILQSKPLLHSHHAVACVSFQYGYNEENMTLSGVFLP